MTGTKDVQFVGLFFVQQDYPVMLIQGAKVKMLARSFASVLKEAGLWDFIDEPEEWCVALALQTLRELGLDTE